MRWMVAAAASLAMFTGFSFAASDRERCEAQAEFLGRAIAMRQAGMGIGQIYQMADQGYQSQYKERPSKYQDEWTKNTLQKIFSDREFLFMDNRAAAEEYMGQCSMNPEKFLFPRSK